MGAMIENYKVEKLGITLPNAYAILKDLTIKGDSVTAHFAIQSTRENARHLQPLEVKTEHFKWDRKTDIAKMAYEKAKGQTTQKDYDYVECKEVETIVNGCLYGWKDDYVTEN